LRIIPYGRTRRAKDVYSNPGGGTYNTISTRYAEKRNDCGEKEQLLARFANLLKINIIETLKTPQDILDSSITVDDVEFAAALATKNKWKATSKLAQKLQRNHSS
jgi:hypothetical protein